MKQENESVNVIGYFYDRSGGMNSEISKYYELDCGHIVSYVY